MQDDQEDMERNTGVDFPGTQIDHHMKKTFKQLSQTAFSINSYYDMIVVEQRSSEGQFMFTYKKNMDKYGKCEGCYQYKFLKVECICKKVKYCDEDCRIRDQNYHLNHCDVKIEVDFTQINYQPEQNARYARVGLMNLGNTCYMNSALQCFSHTYPLAQYFLKCHFINEINYDNPLGSQGYLAYEVSNIMNELWYKSKDCHTPFAIKRQVGQINVMFQGNDQQDSQEFINFLLDGIHEDLNRVKKKPYIELSESKGRPDDIVAEEFWQVHLQRNQSIIVDLMHGQYKNTLICPQCKKISTTFDPYMTIPLSIPQNFKTTYFYVPYNFGTKIYQCDIYIKVSESFMDVKHRIAKHISEYINKQISVYEFVICLIDKRDFVIQQVFQDDSSSSSLNVNDNQLLLMYEIFPEAINTEEIQKCLKEQKQQTKNFIEEEVKNEHEISIVTQNIQYQVLPFKQLIKYNWFHVPLMSLVKYQHTSKQYSMGGNYRNQSSSKEYIPRLLWLNQEWTLQQVHQHVISQFCYLNEQIDSQKDVDQFYQETYKDLLQDLNNMKMIDTDKLKEDFINYPFALNVVNPNKNRMNYSICSVCEQKNCDNCPLPLSNKMSLKELLIMACDPQQFKYNQQLYSAQQEENYYVQNNYYNQIKKLKLFELQLVIVNRIFKKDIQELNSQIMGFNQHPKKSQENSYQSNFESINTCLKLFEKPKVLDKDNEWYCNSCKEHVQATKIFQIYRVPPILVFCFQRFKSQGHYYKQKLSDQVIFPLEDLNMSEFVLSNEQKKDNLIYDLYAVSNHYGNLYGGHYTAYCKNPINNQWYEFDDSIVHSMQENQIITEAAYVLYYQRRGFFQEQENINFEKLKLAPIQQIQEQQQNIQKNQSEEKKKDFIGEFNIIEQEIYQKSNNNWKDLNNNLEDQYEHIEKEQYVANNADEVEENFGKDD